ncbi:hypothetical protein BBJ28_00021797 [Nothophytophthora sp. Chile5]|nr:hypothetical protein BBJ28_00021797 [Nothophytophthora sp. Chile5]
MTSFRHPPERHQPPVSEAAETHVREAQAWKHKLHLAASHKHSDNQLGNGDAAERGCNPVGSTSPVSPNSMAIETSSKKHRFSLKRLFRHDSHEKKAPKPPVQIPSDFLTREKHGGVTVSGRRVPFTREAHKRRQKVMKPMPCITEGRVLGHVYSSKSMEAYRRRAYYPAKKETAKKDTAKKEAPKK